MNVILYNEKTYMCRFVRAEGEVIHYVSKNSTMEWLVLMDLQQISKYRRGRCYVA